MSITTTNDMKPAPSWTKKSRLSPLAGWFGRKGDSDAADLPAMDVSAGLNRALRLNASATAGRTDGAARAAVREALIAIENALYAIDQIRETIEEAYEVALSAREVDDAAGRALLAESYDELRLSIASIAEAAGKGASPLVGKQRRQIDVALGGSAYYSVSPIRLDASESGLSLTPPRQAFANDEEITGALEELDRALGKADKAAAGFCRDAQFLMARLELQDRAAARF